MVVSVNEKPTDGTQVLGRMGTAVLKKSDVGPWIC